MDQFWNNIIAEIEGDQIDEVQVHGVVWKRQRGNFVDLSLLKVQFGDIQMMNKGIFADRGHIWKENNGYGYGSQEGKKGGS